MNWRAMRQAVARAARLAAAALDPAPPLDLGCYTVLWVHGWGVYGDDPFTANVEPQFAVQLGEAANLEAAAALMDREAAAALAAHGGQGEVVVMDRQYRPVQKWRSPARRPRPPRVRA